jgi:hypothetical protein
MSPILESIGSTQRAMGSFVLLIADIAAHRSRKAQ